ncbi:prion-inhibition and propagation-domain-containing protein [Dactylonectria macrodidyma]|uniref:Prion-inhibition and propagation-domain-containing protein n=1 Tax=Dactylonectria macrodidyma TaxID=307937 RepID=A0A9P9CZI8_9HYPO|nr:prion-inhibition and propagation-domain-containing protein [Dactylonectria macrodidyma]
MDPVSLTLATIPIAASLLTSCQAGYEVLCGISSVGDDAQVLLCRLQIEQTRLYLWAKDLKAEGVSFDQQLDSRGIKDLVISIFAQMCHILTDSKRLRSQYGLSAPQPDPQQQPQTTGANDPALTLVIPLFGRHFEDVADVADKAAALKQYAKEVQQSASVLKKLKFSLKDKKKFSGLLDQLRYYNDSLMSLIPPTCRACLDFTLSSRMLDGIADPAELAKIRAAAEGNTGGLSSTAMMKRFRLLIHAPEPSYVSASQLRCARDWLELDNPSAQRCYGEYAPPGHVKQRIIAEWKYYDHNLPREVSVDRIQDIARYLHTNSSYRSPDLPVPKCLGYVEDIDYSRCCFLYSVPEDLPSGSPPSLTTLEDLIPVHFNPVSTPNLEHRLHLARVVAGAVFRLHVTGWLHKGIRSSNIIFPRVSDGNLAHITRPELMGFDYSRPDRPHEESEQYPQRGRPQFDLYVHPEYQQWGSGAMTGSGARSPQRGERSHATRYQRKYDIYSLGVLLLEVALWQPVRTFYKKTFTSGQFIDALMDVAETELGHVVGGKYKEVVKACLNWDDASTAAADRRDNVDPFLTLVVKPLYEAP